MSERQFTCFDIIFNPTYIDEKIMHWLFRPDPMNRERTFVIIINKGTSICRDWNLRWYTRGNCIQRIKGHNLLFPLKMFI